MKAFASLGFVFCLGSILIPSAGLAGKGYMGGQGNIVVENPPPSATTETVVAEQTPTVPTSTSGVPDTVSGPLNDKMADAGKLFGDLYKILRHKGTPGDKKLIPAVDPTGVPILTKNISGFPNGTQLFTVAINSGQIPAPVIGGEPILTVVDAETYPANPAKFSDYGWYSVEAGVNSDGTPIYAAAQSPYPAQCVQPVANYERWGDITPKTGLTKNRLPMAITYDATWGRSECSVGQVSGKVVANPVTGDLTIPTNFQ